ncbi:hypothetical protein SAMN05660653_02768 [Desulfonatronum thiosulfatophilum]|uniref:Uncharacterized protein n=1 Tax=Desulfonatronum thiosulfatophilum TaxID=617002 RepID=A0A1G6EEH1_9BACT|nr:hypothetical protein [Desulfonatronum thiosulfatophilum]SDB55355.1 hypothetical protein SAMN05660653_02768 [Desulfonatronum thiosulfatophilum]
MRKFWLMFVALACVALFSGACADPSYLEGKYQSSSQAALFILLELKPSGQGTWETDMDMVAFRWQQRDGELWLHTQTGGVIVGEIVDRSTLRIVIPGVGPIAFERVS